MLNALKFHRFRLVVCFCQWPLQSGQKTTQCWIPGLIIIIIIIIIRSEATDYMKIYYSATQGTKSRNIALHCIIRLTWQDLIASWVIRAPGGFYLEYCPQAVTCMHLVLKFHGLFHWWDLACPFSYSYFSLVLCLSVCPYSISSFHFAIKCVYCHLIHKSGIASYCH